MHHATCSEELAHVEAWVGVEQFTSDTLREVMHDVDAHIRCIAFCLPVGYDMCIDACSDQIVVSFRHVSSPSLCDNNIIVAQRLAKSNGYGTESVSGPLVAATLDCVRRCASRVATSASSHRIVKHSSPSSGLHSHL